MINELNKISSLYILVFESNNSRFITTIKDDGIVSVIKDTDFDNNTKPLVFCNKDAFIEWYKEIDTDIIGYISYEDQSITHIDVVLYEYHNGLFDYDESICPREVIEEYNIEYDDIYREVKSNAILW